MGETASGPVRVADLFRSAGFVRSRRTTRLRPAQNVQRIVGGERGRRGVHHAGGTMRMSGNATALLRRNGVRASHDSLSSAPLVSSSFHSTNRSAPGRSTMRTAWPWQRP